MHALKRIFSKLTGYWIHNARFLSPGTSLYHDLLYRFGLESPSIIFDVGANTGQTVRFFREFYPMAEIYAFEPVAETFEALRKEVAKLPGRNIPVHLALGGESGELSISLFGGTSQINSLKQESMNDSPNAKQERITITTLDKFCAEKKINDIAILKIDTEGFEKEVLVGARDMLLAGHIPFIYTEVGLMTGDKRHTPFHELKIFLEERGYQFYALYELSHDSFLFGDYYGNALFVHEDMIRKHDRANAR